VPRNAVTAGFDVYVGRVVDGDSRLVASVNLKQPSVYTKFRDTVLESTNFQILAGKRFRWSRIFSNWEIPKDAVPCGHNLDGDMCFIGRTKYENELIVGEISMTNHRMFLVHSSQVISVTEYEVLLHPTEWGKQALSCIPLESNPPQKFKWVAAQIQDTIPKDSIMSGWDAEADVGLYVGRFFRSGEVLPASVAVDSDKKIIKVTAVQSNKEISASFFQVNSKSFQINVH
jgi:Protein of unknown function (DUF3421)